LEIEMPVEKSLEGKVALVFGGSRGIGAGVAKQLAAEGADVALTYVAQPQKAAGVVAEIEGHGVRGLAVKADSAEAGEIRAAVEATIERFGRLDVAVINAGILPLGPIDQVKLEDLDRGLAVNLRGVFLAIQASQSRIGDGGRIITIGSNTAVKAFPGSTVYSMTKAAVAMLVKCAALDLAPRGITVNNIQPGPTLTDMTAEHIDQIQQMIPLNRVGSPSEIGALAAYLAGPQAGYMTGASLTVDGGMSL
jgi:3-oxoacyl-[acyl-carrier protein] reductase